MPFLPRILDLIQKLPNASTFPAIFPRAEAIACEMGERLVGAEHYFLAALENPDNTAARCFATTGRTPAEFRAAIAQEYMEILENIGIDVGFLELTNYVPDPITDAPFPLEKQASALAVFHNLRPFRRFFSRAYISAEVIEAAAFLEVGITARALAALGIDPRALILAAREEARTAPPRIYN